MRRSRIGILIKDVEGFYHHVLWNGFSKGAVENNATLICIAGGSPASNRPVEAVMARYLYGMNGLNKLDGLVVVGTTVCENMSGPETKAFLDRFDIPLVHIGLPIEGHPSITIEQDSGMEQAVRHMVEHHRLERFGIIAGMEYDLESMSRIATIRRTLSDYGLKILPENIIHETFTIESGKRAVQKLCQDGRLRVQCLFCGNDQMAIGALYSLKGMGIQIPEEAALIGFDNVNHLNGLDPPLTTVRQPLREQAETAIRMLKALINGEKVGNETLEAELLIRESCGCPAHTADFSEVRPEDYISRKARSMPPIPMETIEQALSSEENGGEKSFLDLMEKNLRSLNEEEDILVWRTILEDLSSGRLPAAGKISVNPERLYHKASDLITRRILSAETKYFWSIMDIDWRQKLEVLEDIMNATTHEKLYAVLEESCPLAGMEFLRLVHYEKDGDENIQRLVCTYPNTEYSGRIIDCLTDLLPIHEDQYTGNVLVKLIHFRDEVYGFLITEIKPHQWYWYENLKAAIASSLNGIAQIQRLEKAREELRASYLVLDETREKLNKTEYLESLGLIIRGLAHEINGPVGGSLTALTYIKEMLTPEMPEEMKRLTDISIENMKRTGSIVKRLKEVLCDEDKGEMQSFSLHHFIENTFLNSEWCTLGRCPFSIIGSDGIVSNADPHDLESILVELIENTAIHGKQENDDSFPAITVETAIDDEMLLISFEDEGNAITDDEIGRFADPFYTTKRSQGGKGLGLAIVRSIVEIRNNGSFVMEAKPTGGLRVIMSLPWEFKSNS